MSFIDELEWRGLVHQTTHEDLGARLESELFTLYCGFDPTADSLHIGHLLPLIGLARFQRAGHRPIALMGGATGMIGDPSFKSAERSLITLEEVKRNVEGIEQQLRRLLSFEGDNAAIVVNNYDWLGQLSLVDFLRDVGKHFSVNTMMAKDAIRARLEDRDHGISFTEFSYPLLQSYDFLHLFNTYGCRLQIGGSDQWGNIVAGMDLTRRKGVDAATYALTFPLLTKSDGTKFGKTEGGNVWLDPEKTSPYQFYQFWLNQADADTPKYLRSFTFLSKEEIEALDESVTAAPDKREAQHRLAAEVTRIVHGDEALAVAEKATKAMFGGDLAGLDDAALLDIFSDVPSSEHNRSELAGDTLLLDALVEHGLFKSKGEARRMIQSGGVYLNNERVAVDLKLTEASLCSEGIAVVRKGKKHYHLMKFQ